MDLIYARTAQPARGPYAPPSSGISHISRQLMFARSGELFLVWRCTSQNEVLIDIDLVGR